MNKSRPGYTRRDSGVPYPNQRRQTDPVRSTHQGAQNQRARKNPPNQFYYDTSVNHNTYNGYMSMGPRNSRTGSGTGTDDYQQYINRKRIEEQRRRAALKRQQEIRAAEIRKLEEKYRREKKIRRKKKMKIFKARALICIIMFLVISLIASGIFLIHFNSSPDGNSSGKTSYYYGGEMKRSVSKSQSVIDGTVYLCFNDFADFAGISISGNQEEMKFILSDSLLSDGSLDRNSYGTDSTGTGKEEKISFTIGTDKAYVNTQEIRLSAPSYISGENVWVPGDFVSDYFKGLTIDISSDGTAISIDRMKDEEASDASNTVYEDISLVLQKSDPISNSSGSVSDDNINKIEFSNDLSEYEMFMNPENAEDYLILVNKDNLLEADYVPSDLADIPKTRDDGRELQQMRLYAEKSLEALFIEMESAGYTDITVMSGYRSYDYQNTIFYDYVSQEMANDPSLTWDDAISRVSVYSAYPGTSEHQTGLCIDMHNLPSADTAFADSEAYSWLYGNAWKFGFILRFPENKTDITGIQFEPWHWRFVGRYAAKTIYDNGYCLEEYIDQLKAESQQAAD